MRVLLINGPFHGKVVDVQDDAREVLLATEPDLQEIMMDAILDSSTPLNIEIVRYRRHFLPGVYSHQIFFFDGNK